MKLYKVIGTLEVDGEVEIEAESAQEAIEIFADMEPGLDFDVKATGYDIDWVYEKIEDKNGGEQWQPTKENY